MNQTSFTMLGFTQPQTAMPIIEDTQNNAKGFTSRILWFFAQPVFCRMQDTRLTAEETTTLQTFREELGILLPRFPSLYFINISALKNRFTENLHPSHPHLYANIHPYKTSWFGLNCYFLCPYINFLSFICSGVPCRTVHWRRRNIYHWRRRKSGLSHCWQNNVLSFSRGNGVIWKNPWCLGTRHLWEISPWCPHWR